MPSVVCQLLLCFWMPLATAAVAGTVSFVSLGGKRNRRARCFFGLHSAVEEEAARKKVEEEAARKKAEEEAARKKAEEEARRRQV